MRIPWSGKQCILCLVESDLTEEHIIPNSVGGVLTCSFLCKPCNSTLGAKIEAAAKSDPSIRIALQYLESSIPALAGRIHEGQNFLSSGPGGKERGKFRGGQFHVRSGLDEDGRLTQQTKHARKSIAKILQKAGHSDASVTEHLKQFDAASENEKVSLGPGLEAIKRSVDRLEPDLSDSVLMTPLVPLKIAYEFLACHLNTAICAEHPPLNEIRSALKEGNEKHPAFSVERLSSGEYKPVHGLLFEGNTPYAKVQIRLFGWLAFRVHFHHLSVAGPRFVYTHMLDTDSEGMDVVEESNVQP
ncbi:MAG: HNH endonuclease [Neptuniibacter sp.]